MKIFSNMFKIDFIVQAFTANAAETDSSDRPIASQAADPAVVDKQIAQTNTTSASSNINKDSQMVLDILPHLDVDFVVKLLSRYENAELAIGAILECNLPPDLNVNDTNASAAEATIIPEQTLSVDNDAQLNEVTKLLDNIGVDDHTTVIIRTDKRKPVRMKDARKILDDKRAVTELKSRYYEYGYVSEDYEDEYDDSYEALAESETKSVNQQLKQSGALNVVMDDVDDSESDSSDDNGLSGGRDTRRDFCENPEVVRERLARMRNNRQSNQRKGPPPTNQ